MFLLYCVSCIMKWVLLYDCDSMNFSLSFYFPTEKNLECNKKSTEPKFHTSNKTVYERDEKKKGEQRREEE